MSRPPYLVLAVYAAILGVAVAANAQVCGDVDGNSIVTAGDALRVLKKAVGQSVELTCKAGDCIALEARLSEVEAATPRVYDANGDLVGRLVGSAHAYTTRYEQVTVADKSTGKLIEFWQYDGDDTVSFFEEFDTPGNDEPLAYVFYTTADCSGTPYILTEADLPYTDHFLRVFSYSYSPFDVVTTINPVQPASGAVAIKSESFFGDYDCEPFSQDLSAGVLYQGATVTPSFGARIELPLRTGP
ncbi:MAG TPA: hypothetical protein VGK20_03495 [Candidatus Binatia bacterium]|jgi:hypothetical protein